LESPALWAVCAWCRRQNEQSPVGDTPTISSTPTQNGQTIDDPVAGDLSAAGDQGDRQALADTSTMQLSAPATVDFASATTTSTTTFAQVKAARQTNPDTTAPTVSVTAPSGTVSGTVTLSATAIDNAGGSGVAGVQFKLDGAKLGTEDTSSPYSVSWNTTTVANGTHTLTAVARDAAGNITTSTPVTVKVDNAAPAVSLNGPAAGTVKGRVTVGAAASDNVGVVGVQFKVDGADLGPEDTTGPYVLSWDTTTVADGSHTLTAVARDAAGNIKTSAGLQVTVANIGNSAPVLNGAPTVGAPDPDTGTVTGSFTVTEADGDLLSYSIMRPASGELAVFGSSGPATTYTYNFNYTPSQAARDQAKVTPGPDTDSFTVSVTDGISWTHVTVTVPIEPRPGDMPIWQGPTTATRDGYTGRITGNINAIDPDGDPLTYATTYGPWYGTMTLEAGTGNYVYTPFLNADQGVLTDELVTVAVSDGTYTIYKDWWILTFRDDLAPL